MIFEEYFTLNNGVKIPKLGLGTWLIDNADTAQAVNEAIKIGYRHIDTAQAYGNEQGVGEGIRTSMAAREEIFVTSKVAAEAKSYDAAMKSIDGSLATMGLDYIDLMIIHSPQPWMEVNQSENRYLEENKEVWRALEDAYHAGKLKAIGVSNFLQADIENLLTDCKVKPMVNQVLAHASNTPLALIEFCQKHEILMEAYSPIAHGAVLNNEELSKIAANYNASVAQLCIRYVMQLGMVALPKTANPAHMSDNAKLDFVISNEHMEILKNLEQIKDYGAHSFFPVFGGKL